MKRGETEEDIRNIEAWAAIIEDLLCRVPHELRTPILELAAREQKRRDEEYDPNRVLVTMDFSPESIEKVNQSFGVRHRRTVMRLKSLVIQVFARSIKNNHSPEEGDAILLAEHPYGYGSRLLEDYLPEKQ